MYYLPIYLFTYLPIYLFTYLPIYLFTYLPMYLINYSRRMVRLPLFALLFGVLLFSCSKSGGDDPAPVTYKLTLSPPTKGKVEGEKATYKKDEVTEITAKAIEGYAFSHWTGVADGIKTQNPLMLKMTAKVSLAAVFVKTYTLHVVALPNGSVKGQKATYKKDEVATIEANANDGYLFSKWLGDVPAEQTAQNPLKLKITAHAGLIAEFVKKSSITYSLKLTAPTHGEVTGNKPTYNPDEITNIAALPADGYYFNKWTGDVPKDQETQNPLKLKMTKAIALGVEFKKRDLSKSHKLTLTTPTNGNVIGSKSTYTDGETTDILAAPDKDYTFSHWTGVSDGNKNANPLRIAVTEDLTLAAVFVKETKTATYALTLKATTGGEVTQSPDQATFKSGETVSLTATPTAGYVFDQWMGADVPSGKGETNPLTVTMDKDKTLTATFVKKTYTLTLTSPSNGTVSGNQPTYTQDDLTHITAAANQGYTFSKWTGVPKLQETQNPLTLKMTANTTLAAVFAKKTYALSVQTVNGTVSGNQPTYAHGEMTNITATPSKSYGFEEWVGVPEDKKHENPLQIEIAANTSITAVFRRLVYVADNGVTLKASRHANVGDTVRFSGRDYIIADNASLEAALRAGKDVTLYITSRVTDMRRLSSNFPSRSTFNQDIGAWDVSQITDMFNMFFGASSFNQDIGHWDVSQVTNMEGMFASAFSFNQDIGKWDVGKVTNMKDMFRNIAAFNQDIGGWDVSEVTDMYGMFRSSTAFNQDLSRWKTGKVTDMAFMFREAEVFNQDIGGWDVSQVTDMGDMFNGAKAFNQDLSRWKVGEVTEMGDMFNGATSFNQDLSGWCVEKIAKRQNGFDTGATLWTDAAHKPVWGDASKCTN